MSASARRAIIVEARKLYSKEGPHGLTWPRALAWAHHKARARRNHIEAQMADIRAAIEAEGRPSLGPYGRR